MVKTDSSAAPAPREEKSPARLGRGIGLGQAIATNLLSMIGVGPFLALPIMVSAQGGPHILYAWLIGGVLALCDGLVYAHFAAALPAAGGPVAYLREAYRPLRLGSLMPFLFLFQTLLIVPLSMASGAVAFAQYASYYGAIPPPAQHMIAAGLCLLITAALYRNIESAARLSIAMLVVVGITLGWVIIVGAFQFSPTQAFTWPKEAFVFDGDLVRRIGQVSLQAMYCYGGYNMICYLGEEVRTPRRTLPWAILVSIAVVVVLYIAMSTVILGLIPWQEVKGLSSIASVFIERSIADPGMARTAGAVMTGLILFVTASGLYALLLGASRVPFAAARDGLFFRPFAALHPRKQFPHVSLLTLGMLSVPFCFFSFERIVGWLMMVQIAMQFVWQCGGVMLLHRYRKDLPQPFVMWLYPLPAIVALAMWIYVFLSAELAAIAFAGGVLALGVLAFGVRHLARRA